MEAHPPLIQRKTLAQSLRGFHAFMYGEVVGLAIPTLFWIGAFFTGFFLALFLSLTSGLKPHFCEVVTHIEAEKASHSE